MRSILDILIVYHRTIRQCFNEVSDSVSEIDIERKQRQDSLPRMSRSSAAPLLPCSAAARASPATSLAPIQSDAQISGRQQMLRRIVSSATRLQHSPLLPSFSLTASLSRSYALRSFACKRFSLLGITAKAQFRRTVKAETMHHICNV